MNITEYIESGILEQYAMGTVSAQEKQEVECMSHIYPEIAAELLSVQSTMEAFAKASSKTPPSHLRDKILGSLHDLAEQESVSNVTSNISSIPSTDTIVSSDSNSNVGMRLGYSTMRIAAAILFLCGLGLAFLLFKNNQTRLDQEKQLTLIQQELETKNQFIQNQQAQLAVMQNPEYQKIALNGIPAKSPDAKASIYWNKKSNEVFLSITSLPQPSADKEYQLWAIADGKPVDLGMVSGENIDSVFQKMKTIENPQAFAITLEKKGGVISPTMSEMYVMGGV